MAKFRILHITNNLDEHPHCAKDSDEFPTIVGWVKDEYEMFILDVDGGSIFPASEFFYMLDESVSTFNTNTQGLEDELFIATTYIKSIRKQCAYAENAKEEHTACWAAVKEAPIVVNNRIELRDKDKTFIELKRNA